MSIEFPTFEQPMTREMRAELAKELSQNPEGFKFSGLEDGVFEKLKAEGDEMPGFATPIEELVERFERLGLKVALGDDPNNGGAWILPKDGTDVEMDSILPRHLKITDEMDPKLKKLVQAHKDLFNAKK